MALLAAPIPHGTVNGYKHHKCRCDECKTAKKAEQRAYYLANREKVRAGNEAWKAANRERVRGTDAARYEANRDGERAKRAAYYRDVYSETAKAKTLARRHADLDAAREREAAWRAANPDRMLAYKRAWKRRNPQQAANDEQTRRARELAAFVEHVDRTVVWTRDDGWCHICGLAADVDDWHLDHVIPLVRGGLHEYANVAVTHPICNLRKGAS